MENASMDIYSLVIMMVLLTLTCIGLRHFGFIHECFIDRTYISTLHVSSRSSQLTICVGNEYLPCVDIVRSLANIQTPVTPIFVTSSRSIRDYDVQFSHLIKMSIQTRDVKNKKEKYKSHSSILTACPGADLVLVVVACIPHDTHLSTLNALVNTKHTIYCSSKIESRLITDICKSAIDPFEIHTSIQPLDAIEQGIIVLLRPPNHHDVLHAMARQGAAMIPLPQLDPHIFAMHQPLAKLTSNTSRGGSSVSSTCVLIVNRDLDGDPRALAIASQLINLDAMWSLGEITMASRFLPILPSTLAQLGSLNNVAEARNRIDSHQLFASERTLSILQVDGFEESHETVVLVSSELVEGYIIKEKYDGRAKTFETRSQFIGAARMRLGDRVRLREQPNSLHNGDYVVQQLPVGDRGTVLVSWFEAVYDAISFVDLHIDERKVKGISMTVTMEALSDPNKGRLWPTPTPSSLHAFSATRLEINDLVLLNNLKDGDGVWTRVVCVDGGLVTLDTLDDDPKTIASEGLCVTSPTTLIQSVCLKRGGSWDAPCVSDDECPFFQMNKHYPNYRGGCASSGWCEMPLGVKQESYRSYSHAPICHNTMLGRGHVSICDSQRPDLAFALDEFERSSFIGVSNR